jgi:ferritin-like metal-binding protein YciE
MHAARVEEVFVAAGAEPAAAASAALQGLQQEYGALVGSIVEPRLRDLFLVSAASKTEHLEIALYAGVIPLARRVTGEAGDLEQNLAEEQQALIALEQAGEALLARTPA